MYAGLMDTGLLDAESSTQHADIYLDLLKSCLTASLYDESSNRIVESARHPHERHITSPRHFIKGLVRAGLVRLMRRKGFLLVRQQPFDGAARDEGRDWPSMGYTMVGHRRLENVQHCVETVLREYIPGDFIETGVWRGGTVIFLRALLKMHDVTDRIVWAADSFEGLPTPASRDDRADLSEVESLKISLEQVKANFRRFGLLDDQVRFLKGWFCDTLPTAPIDSLAILRLDGDLYSSTMDSLRNLYHKVSPGGFVIVDDYYSWPECRRAITDFLDEHHIHADIQRIDWTGAYWRADG